MRWLFYGAVLVCTGLLVACGGGSDSSSLEKSLPGNWESGSGSETYRFTETSYVYQTEDCYEAGSYQLSGGDLTGKVGYVRGDGCPLPVGSDFSYPLQVTADALTLTDAGKVSNWQRCDENDEVAAGERNLLGIWDYREDDGSDCGAEGWTLTLYQDLSFSWYHQGCTCEGSYQVSANQIELQVENSSCETAAVGQLHSFTYSCDGNDAYLLEGDGSVAVLRNRFAP